MKARPGDGAAETLPRATAVAEPLAAGAFEGLDLLRCARRVGYVFAGGSVRCAFQIGVVEALAELGVRPALTVGASAGAWNAAMVSARIIHRMRYYWKTFVRMPRFDLRNLLVDHSPWRFRRMHKRVFDKFIGRDRFRQPDALPLFVSVTRIRDRENVIFGAHEVDDPLELLLATNYLVPYYTHPPEINGSCYCDGGVSDNAPYEKAFAEGCDAVVLVALKGDSEGQLFKSARDREHVIPPEFASRMVVVRPRHRLPISFTENRWSVLGPLADVGYLRTREVLLAERHPETDLCAKGEAPSAKIERVVNVVRRVFA
ncbi:MAG TPA: patatin-like phospholipase family protein [Thermoanaerobaculia bacterium]|nr:patatin-like phospholipase family protein [Thermoanaerobaculia bacterium]